MLEKISDKKIDILFVRIGGIDKTRYGIRGTVECKLIEPIGPEFCVAYLRYKGAFASIYDLSLHLDEDKAIKYIVDLQPSILGFSILYSHMMDDSYRFIAKLRKEGLKSHITIGGTYPTLNADEVLRNFYHIDSVVRVEGEITCHDLLRAVKGEIRLSDVEGLSYKLGKHVVHNSPRPLIENLSEMPFPSRDDFDAYTSLGGIVQIHSSRGCHANCSFCSTAAFYRKAPGNKWRSRNASNVVDEIELLLKQSPTNEIWFTDDNFIGPGEIGNERAKLIAEKIIKRGLDIKFIIQSRADNLRVDTIRKLKKAGLRKVYIGIESGIDSCLKTFNKKTTALQNASALKLLENEEVFAELGFIGFDPFTTVEDFSKNVDFLTEICGKSEYIHLFAFDMLLPYRGTPISDFLLKSNKAVENGIDYQSVISDQRINLAWRLTDNLLVQLGLATERIKALIIGDDSREDAKHCIRLKNEAMLGCLNEVRNNIFQNEEIIYSDKHSIVVFIYLSVAKLNSAMDEICSKYNR